MTLRTAAVTVLAALALAACSAYEGEQQSIGGGLTSTPTPTGQDSDEVGGPLVKLDREEACYSTTGGSVSNVSFPPVCYPLAKNFKTGPGVTEGANVRFVLDRNGARVKRLELR